jgi:hypothetical protein
MKFIQSFLSFLNEKKEEVLPSSNLDSLGECFSGNTVKNTERNVQRFQSLLFFFKDKKSITMAGLFNLAQLKKLIPR